MQNHYDKKICFLSESKSKENERKRRVGEKMTKEKQEKGRAKAQERMKLLRNKKSSEEIDQDRESAKKEKH